MSTEATPQEERKPYHASFLHGAMRWDWRKENAVEVILLVFVLTFFFALPRAGCGITARDQALEPPAVGAPLAVPVPAPSLAP